MEGSTKRNGPKELAEFVTENLRKDEEETMTGAGLNTFIPDLMVLHELLGPGVLVDLKLTGRKTYKITGREGEHGRHVCVLGR